MSTTSLQVAPAELGDVKQIVDIHLRAFNGFFLTTLGKGFLKLYYDSVRCHPDGILLKCTREGCLIGFCAGTMLSAGFNTRLVKSRLMSYVFMGIKLVFTRPGSLWHLFRNFSKEETNKGDLGDYAELLSIGVDPNIQRSGAGKELLMSLEAEVSQRGGKRLSLTTDYNDNQKAIGFYHALGYSEWYDFVTYPSRRMYRMIKTL